MTSPWIASLLAIFVWWFSTGAILLAVRRADRAGNHVMLVIRWLPLLVFGIGAVAFSLPDATAYGAYLGFVGALAIWGWIELSFLAGVITGPVRDGAITGQTAKDHFFRAFSTVAYHELAIVLGLLGLVVASKDAANGLAMSTFLVLFLARILAKLNLFFGVPRINTEFVPDQLIHLKSYFRKGPITWAFPTAVTVLTAVLAVCAERLWTAQSDAAVVGFALLTALTALALLEHWLMIVPLPDAKLWRWMLPAPKTTLPNED